MLKVTHQGEVEVALTFSVDGNIDQALVDHLGQSVEMMVHRMREEGTMTPQDDEERIITLESVTSKAT